MTQKELADKSNLSLGCISDAENCKKTPTIDSLNKIAVALNIDLDQLLVDSIAYYAKPSDPRVALLRSKFSGLDLDEKNL